MRTTSPLSRAHPEFGGFDLRLWLPDRRTLGMVARANWNRVEVLEFVGLLTHTLTLQKLAEGVQSRRRLPLVNAAGEQVGHVIGVARVHEHRKSERGFPKIVQHILQDIYRPFAKRLIISEGIRQIWSRTTQVPLDERSSKLCFAHANCDSEGKDGVNKSDANRRCISSPCRKSLSLEMSSWGCHVHLRRAGFQECDG